MHTNFSSGSVFEGAPQVTVGRRCLKYLGFMCLLRVGVAICGCAPSPRLVSVGATPTPQPAPTAAPRAKKPLAVAEDLGEMRGAELSSDKRSLVIGTLVHVADNSARGWVLRRDARSGALLGKWRVPGGVSGLSLSRDQTMLATVNTRHVMLWAWPSGKLLRSSEIQSGVSAECDLSPDGRTLAVATGDLLLFDVGTWKRLPRLPLPDPPFVIGVRFSPDGKRLVTSHADIDVSFLLWDLRSRRSRELINAGGGGSMVFSPDGRLVASATYAETCLHDARSGLRLKYLQRSDSLPKGVDNPFAPLDFSPDSRLLAARSDGGSDKGGLEIWDMRIARRIRVLPPLAGAVFWVQPRVLLACSRDAVRRVPLHF